MACLPVSENVQYLIAESITRRRAADSTDSTARRDNEVRLFFLDWYERFQGADTRIRRLFAEQGFQECSKCRRPAIFLAVWKFSDGHRLRWWCVVVGKPAVCFGSSRNNDAHNHYSEFNSNRLSIPAVPSYPHCFRFLEWIGYGIFVVRYVHDSHLCIACGFGWKERF